MKKNIENLSISIIFIFLIILSYLQATTQSFGYITDQDWTMIYNPILLASNIEQNYIDHPAYTTFLIFSLYLEIIKFFSSDLNLDIFEILKTKNPEENLQNIFIYLRIINSIIISLIYFVLYKILKLFNIQTFYITFILLFFLFFESIYELLFLLRSEALSVLLFLVSSYFILKYYKNNLEIKYIIYSSIFFTLTMLTKSQTILLFLSSPFIFFFLKQRFIKEQNKTLLIKKSYEKIIFILGFFVIVGALVFYTKYPAPTDFIFFTVVLLIYLIFCSIYEKINFEKIKEILNFILIFIFGIVLTFAIILTLDLLNIIPFNNLIIPMAFTKPITHMAMFSGENNISQNNLLLMLSKIMNFFLNFKGISYLLMKHKFIIIFIPIFSYYIYKKKLNKDLFYIFFLFSNFIFITSIFVFFIDYTWYQIYFIPMTLLILIEFARLDKKILFCICILFFAITNFQTVRTSIAEGFIGERKTINVCGYGKVEWDSYLGHKINFEHFHSLFCQKN